LESRGAALRLIAAMLASGLASSDRAAAAFPEAGAMPHLQLDAASLRASLPTPSIVRTMARDYGRALLAWPQLWSFCRERFA
jgi:hypothetical protein